MKKVVCLIFSFLIGICAFAEGNTPRVEKSMPFSKGLNLSGWLEPYSKTNINSALFGKQDFIDIKNMGVEIVRVPVHFDEFSSGKPDYVIPEWLWKKVDDAVAWCTELKLYMIIDNHNDCDGDSKTSPDYDKMLEKVWKQVAERYKDSSEYILYEIMNEPHVRSGNLDADIAKYNKVQGKILKLIRSIDTKHTVILESENWANIDALLTIPDYKDDNVIYNFHYYEPFAYTYQGATWCHLEDLRGLPFPYDESKMPPLPKNANNEVRYQYEAYKNFGSYESITKPLDAAVKLANKRNVPLMINEWGAMLNYLTKEERLVYYKFMVKAFDERNIIRISWDYKDQFGIFNDKGFKTEYPNDVNVELIEAMGYKIPPDAKPISRDWLKTSYKDGEYVFYKNGFPKNITSDAWITPCNKKDRMFFSVITDGDMFIQIPSAKVYNGLRLTFTNETDLSSLVDKNLTLEFEIKTTQKDFRLDIYFKDKGYEGQGKNGFEWRKTSKLRDKDKVNDGQWHTVRIPLKSMYETGAWNDKEKKYYNPEGLFKWNKVEKLVFDFVEKDQTEEFCIRNIVIK